MAEPEMAAMAGRGRGRGRGSMKQKRHGPTGTLALRTLKKPNVNTLREVFATPGVDRSHAALAEAAELTQLLELTNHENAKIKVLATKIISSLTLDGDDVSITDAGFDPLKDLLGYKEPTFQQAAAWTLANLAEHAETSERLVHEIGWKHIIKFCKKDDAELQLAMATLLANLALHPVHQEVMVKEEALNVLLAMLKSKDIRVQRAAMSAIANLLIEGENVTKFVSSGADVSALFALVRSDDEELLRGAVTALANIAAASDDIKKHLISDSEGLIAPLVRLLSSPNPAILKGAAMTLAHAAAAGSGDSDTPAPGAAALSAAGAVVPLMQLLTRLAEGGTDADAELTLCVVMAVNNLVQHEGVREECRDKGVVAPLLKLREAWHGLDAVITKELTAALTELGELREEAKEDPTQVKEVSPEAREEAAAASANETPEMALLKEYLQYKENNVPLRELDPNAPPPQPAAPASPEPTKKISKEKAAAIATRALAMTVRPTKVTRPDNTTFEYVIEYDVISRRLANVTAFAEQSKAVDDLLLIASRHMRRPEIANSGTLSAVVSVLATSDRSLLLRTLRLLSMLLKLDSKRINIAREAGAVPHVLGILAPNKKVKVKGHEALRTDPEVLIATLDVVYWMARDSVKVQNEARDLKAHSVIAALLEGKHSDAVKLAAARALGGLSRYNRKMQQLIKKTGAIPHICKLLTVGEDPQKRDAGIALHYIVDSDTTNQNIARSKGAIDPTIKFISSDNPQMKEIGCALLASLCRNVNTKNQNTFRDNKVFGPLIACLTHPDIHVQRQAFPAVLELVRENNRVTEAICYSGVVVPVISGLDSPDNSVVYFAEGCIWMLAKKNATRRQAFVEAGAVDKLKLIVSRGETEVLRLGAGWVKDLLEVGWWTIEELW